MNFQIKNFKSQRGIEGIGFYCTLWIDGVKAAEVIDEAHGGPYHWHWFDHDAERRWTKYVSEQPESPSLFSGLPPSKADEDEVMADIVERYELTKKCKNKTLYRVKGQKEGEYWSEKVPFTPQVAERLRNEQPDLVEILNETISCT